MHCRTCGKRNKDNSLIDLCPSVKDYWVYEKNEHNPEYYTISSGKKVFLRCPDCGKERELAIADAIAKDKDGNYYVTSCLDCFKVKALQTKRQGDNNIKKAVVDIDKLWGKENTYKPEELTVFSREKIYTLCPTCGTTLYRNAHNSFQKDEDGKYHVLKCQNCAALESARENALQRSGSVLESCPEIDEWWDYDRNYTSPEKLTYGSHYEAYLKCPKCGEEIKRDLHSFIAMHRDGRLLPVECPTCGYSAKGDPEDNILKLCPEIEKWWNYKKNYPFRPEQFTKGSQFFAYLTCPDCGLELYSVIHSLLYTKEDGTVSIRHKGLCRKYRAMDSENNLVKLYPEITKWWDYEKNYPNKPEEFTTGARYYAHFKCPDCGCETIKRISDAFKFNSEGVPAIFECPYCNDIRAYPGYNSFKARHPEIVEREWIEDKNNELGLDPDYLLDSSRMIAWWKCPDCGNEYQMSVHRRATTDIKPCPYCSGRKALAGYNSLKFKHPELIETEWAEEENMEKGLDSDDILEKSTKVAWWRCKTCGNLYEMSIRDRLAIEGDPCPYCTERKALPGFNSFKTKHPELVEKEWAELENMFIRLDPDQILDTSTKTAWWKCPICGNYYLMSVKQRLLKEKRGHNPCAFCNGRRLRKRFNI